MSKISLVGLSLRFMAADRTAAAAAVYFLAAVRGMVQGKFFYLPPFQGPTRGFGNFAQNVDHLGEGDFAVESKCECLFFVFFT